eukprot:CAMPEP_0198310316 /NCGR_PEP_ID=MMETSP1450-20131203/2434_1 /TAXON_ID=753684 ORGANISM="Madagascaria erythrocladiodes, Strain CCMP3234" /NCGR_SAMPLE_ID=MMETSP1450 /ASSEMBLY_ACC=CAM_ASM_001115 /LENGTH=249 /DNA_ID=CAMNT_0044013135 /DNA_START=54 /DNA_END=803 /DNA_ORIENTATION=+
MLLVAVAAIVAAAAAVRASPNVPPSNTAHWYIRAGSDEGRAVYGLDFDAKNSFSIEDGSTQRVVALKCDQPKQARTYAAVSDATSQCSQTAEFEGTCCEGFDRQCENGCRNIFDIENVQAAGDCRVNGVDGQLFTGGDALVTSELCVTGDDNDVPLALKETILGMFEVFLEFTDFVPEAPDADRFEIRNCGCTRADDAGELKAAHAAATAPLPRGLRPAEPLNPATTPAEKFVIAKYSRVPRDVLALVL